MSYQKRTSRKSSSHNKPITTKKSMKFKQMGKRSLQTNISEFQQQEDEQVRIAKQVLMMQSEGFQQQHQGYKNIGTNIRVCSIHDKKSNRDWGTQMIEEIQLMKKQQRMYKQKNMSKININNDHLSKPLNLITQDENNHSKSLKKQIVQSGLNRIRQNFTTQNQQRGMSNWQQNNSTCRNIQLKKININPRFQKVFNGTKVQVRQKNMDRKVLGLSPKEVIFNSNPKIYTQKTISLDYKYQRIHEQVQKNKKTLQYISAEGNKRTNHQRTCSQNNNHLAQKNRKIKERQVEENIPSQRKLSQVIQSTSYSPPLNTTWAKQTKNQIKQQINSHTFCIKQMVASYINKKQSQKLLQSQQSSKNFKQLIYKPMEPSAKKSVIKMKQTIPGTTYKSYIGIKKQKRKQKEKNISEYFSLNNSQSKNQKSKKKQSNQVKIKNIQLEFQNKQGYIYKVQQSGNTKDKEDKDPKERNKYKCFQYQNQLYVRKQHNRIKTSPELTKITHINPYMMKIIQIQQKYKQKIQLEKLDIKNIIIS